MTRPPMNLQTEDYEIMMHALKIEHGTNAGGGTPLQQELSEVTAELSKTVTRLHELSARKAKLELRQMVSGA